MTKGKRQMSASETPDGLVSCHMGDGLATLTLQRPARSNALSVEMRLSLDEALKRALGDPAVRVVVLRGEGRNFCAGADLDSLPDAPFPWRDRLRMAQDQHARMMRSDKIVVAAVQGAAAGGGASLAMAADILLMAEGARLVFPFLRLGLVPDGGAAFLLSAKLGPARAADLLLTGGSLAAQDAHQAGLASRVVAPDRLEAETAEIAARLLAQPEGTLALTKNMLRGAWARDLQAAFDHEVDAMALATELPGHARALAALKQG